MGPERVFKAPASHRRLSGLTVGANWRAILLRPDPASLSTPRSSYANRLQARFMRLSGRTLRSSGPFGIILANHRPDVPFGIFKRGQLSLDQAIQSTDPEDQPSKNII
jgi:hypothetical protein